MKSKYLMIGAAVCAALFLFSGIMLCRQYADEQQSAEAFEQVAGGFKGCCKQRFSAAAPAGPTLVGHST